MKNDNGFPARTTKYVGLLTDTDRWDAFQPRADDIFVCTPPKCGTTWTQAICANLIFGKADFEGKITDISPWIDSKIESEEICARVLKAQTHRRFIKTHTPLDGIPYFESCEYLIVYRDPRDAYFSIRNHLRNMRNTPDMPQLAEDPKEGFVAWVESPFKEGVGDQRSLEAFTRHYLSFWKFRHLENFHFFHYSDMKRDLDAAIRQIAAILNIAITDSRVEEISKAVSFKEMKKKASAFTPFAGKPFFRNDEAFFSSGSDAQWRGVLGAEELERYERRMRQLLIPEVLEWLERGSV